MLSFCLFFSVLCRNQLHAPLLLLYESATTPTCSVSSHTVHRWLPSGYQTSTSLYIRKGHGITPQPHWLIHITPIPDAFTKALHLVVSIIKDALTAPNPLSTVTITGHIAKAPELTLKGQIKGPAITQDTILQLQKSAHVILLTCSSNWKTGRGVAFGEVG